MTNYKQCHLAHETLRQVAWIEERGAKVGNKVEVLADGLFWEVLNVYDTVLTKEQLGELEKNRRNSTYVTK